jgi:hypothetical protein
LLSTLSRLLPSPVYGITPERFGFEFGIVLTQLYSEKRKVKRQGG